MKDIQFSRLRSVFAVRTDATMKTQFLRFQQRRLLLAVQDILLELSSQSYSLSFSKSEGIVLLFCTNPNTFSSESLLVSCSLLELRSAFFKV